MARMPDWGTKRFVWLPKKQHPVHGGRGALVSPDRQTQVDELCSPFLGFRITDRLPGQHTLEVVLEPPMVENRSFRTLNRLQAILDAPRLLTETGFLLAGRIARCGPYSDFSDPGRTFFHLVGLVRCILGQRDDAHDRVGIPSNGLPVWDGRRLNVDTSDFHDPLLGPPRVSRQPAHGPVLFDPQENVPASQIEQSDHLGSQFGRRNIIPLELDSGRLVVADQLGQFGPGHLPRHPENPSLFRNRERFVSD